MIAAQNKRAPAGTGTSPFGQRGSNPSLMALFEIEQTRDRIKMRLAVDTPVTILAKKHEIGVSVFIGVAHRLCGARSLFARRHNMRNLADHDDGIVICGLGVELDAAL